MPGREVIAEIRFGQGGNSDAHLVSGWSYPEPGYVWMVGPESRLQMPLPPREQESECFLLLDLAPMGFRDHRTQSLTLYANGVLVGATLLTKPGHVVVGFALPPATLAAETLEIEFYHPDRLRPADHEPGTDDRVLAVSIVRLRIIALPPRPAAAPRTLPPLRVRQDSGLETVGAAVADRAGAALAAVLLDVESLGHACTLGFVQRACEQEPLGLLRWGGFPAFGDKLGQAIANRLEGFGRPENIDVYVADRPDREYMATETLYGLHRPTHAYEGKADPAALIAHEKRRLPFLARKFVEDMDEGRKTFVLVDPSGGCAAEALAVYVALNLHADNTLLWLIRDEAPPGQVELTRPGLMRGAIDRGPGGQGSFEAWISVCANAYALKHGTAPGIVRPT